ncbi:hypothetical protein [Cypionkella sp.]|uniref:hypothetical protein n=1 Tax=Cypionkella sp. TaxID=2811411 RepID=UPI00261C2A3F|nr:hypothetical protein [Cypionkella sp.]
MVGSFYIDINLIKLGQAAGCHYVFRADDGDGDGWLTIGMAGCLRLATGLALGGWGFDAAGSYGGLCITCRILGLVAFAIAMTFQPFARPPMVAFAA